MIKLISKNWEIDNIQAVLFDKDGTFIDLHFFWGKITEMRAEKTCENFQLPISYLNKLCSFLGYDTESKKMLSNGITALYSRNKIIEIYNQCLIDMDLKSSEAIIETIFDEVNIEFYKNINDYILPINEAIELIKKLHAKGIKLGIVTADSVESTKITLKNNNWENLFQVIIGRESCCEPKESGIPAQIALESLGISSKNAVMIGDTPTDYLSAQKAGIKNTILVASGQINSEELKKTTPFVLESLKDLICI